MAEPGRSLVHIGLTRLVPLCRVKFDELDSWMARGHRGGGAGRTAMVILAPLGRSTLWYLA